MIKGVIFDLDGTILNTIEDLANAMNYMLRQFGYPEHHDLQHHMQLLGTGARHYVQMSMPVEVAAQETQVDACLAAYRQYYEANTNIKTKPYDGILDVMAFLTKENIQIAILSNKPDVSTKLLAKEWFSGYPLVSIYGERTGIPRKPDPAGPLAIAEEMGLSPSQIAFIGDSDVDIKTGLNAGMTTIGVLWGFRSKEQLEEAGGRLLAQTPSELISLLKQLNQ